MLKVLNDCYFLVANLHLNKTGLIKYFDMNSYILIEVTVYSEYLIKLVHILWFLIQLLSLLYFLAKLSIKILLVKTNKIAVSPL